MRFFANKPTNVGQISAFLERFEQDVRKDERRQMSIYLDALENKVKNEIRAYSDFLSGESKDTPDKISVDLF